MDTKGRRKWKIVVPFVGGWKCLVCKKVRNTLRSIQRHTKVHGGLR